MMLETVPILIKKRVMAFRSAGSFVSQQYWKRAMRVPRSLTINTIVTMLYAYEYIPYSDLLSTRTITILVTKERSLLITEVVKI